MGIFTPIELVWGGRSYTIPADKVMGAVCCVEDVVTMSELAAHAHRGGVQMAKLARAYAAVLRYAGAQVLDEEVYRSMFTGDGASAAVTRGVQGILQMCVPVAARPKRGGEADAGNSQAAGVAS
jgi:hypothetical protein